MRWLVLVLLLAGCASQKPEPLPRVVMVDVPVVIPCPVAVPPVEIYATARLTKQSTDFEKIKALLVERKARKQSEDELRDLLQICVKPR